MGSLRRAALRAARGQTAPAVKQARGFPDGYKRLRSPVRRMGWLCGPECEAAVAEGRLQQNQIEKEKKGLEDRMRRVGVIVPGPARLSDAWNGEEFPPKPDDPANTLKTADLLLNPRVEAEVVWPAYWITRRTEGWGKNKEDVGGETYDYRTYKSERKRQAMGLGSGRRTESPTTVALERLEQIGGMVTESKLPTEDKAVLERQLERYKVKKDLRPFQAEAS